jgi:hypothetical protein
MRTIKALKKAGYQIESLTTAEQLRRRVDFVGAGFYSQDAGKVYRAGRFKSHSRIHIGERTL